MNQDLLLNNPIKKQDLVSVLSPDLNSCHKILTTRDNIRTYSVDMSLPKWLQNNGSSLKMVQSSYELQALREQDCHDINDIWSSIQADNRSWGCILSPTKNDGPYTGSPSGQLPPPYVHPMEKRPSSLSGKSLEICTESLGSETGSDGFLCSSSELEEASEEHFKCEREEKEKGKEGEKQVVEVNAFSIMGNSNSSCSRRRMSMVISPSFPPPIPSLGKQGDGTNLQIRSHREDGRLVVEAVSIPCRNCFRAERQDGRLLLTLLKEQDEDVEVGKSQEQGETKSGIDEEQVKVRMSETQVLVPRTATVTIAVNAYEYYWRATSNATTMALVWGNTHDYNIHFNAQQLGKDTKWNTKNLLSAAHNTKGREEILLMKHQDSRRRGNNNNREYYVVPFMLRINKRL